MRTEDMPELSTGVCETCKQQFGYRLLHNGFNDSIHAYCDSCGKTAVLSMFDKRLPRQYLDYQEITSTVEPYLEPCTCGGRFRRGAKPRCPHCNATLSAELAASYIEPNTPGTQSGWSWQRNWSGLYAIVIADNCVKDNFAVPPKAVPPREE